MDEILRLLYNLVRTGTISAVDYSAAAPRVRVKTGDLETNWLPWMEYRAGTTKTWNPLTVGEQVIVFSPNGDLDEGIVLGAINSNNNPAPSNNRNHHITRYPDGATFVYDHNNGALSISGVNIVNFNIGSSININCPTININGSIFQRDGVIDSNGVVLDNHVHNGVSPGGSTTGGPV
ncbi:hypothetical protein AAEX37_01018 [Oligella sp. MSHR50489EDL]|uniref:phage baseplate assembly protein V n=1 Tax=Oligella sp. MSHR50489EDL TaxID=3139409 RepID=UPI003D81826B